MGWTLNKMNILETNFISIDSWSPLVPEKTTFLLTHVHTDHADIPKTFAFPVYSSVTSGHLMEHRMLDPCLVPGRWYQTHLYHIPFRVVDTVHCVDSIGFLFPTLSIMFIGDGTVPTFPLHTPLTVIYDDLYEHIDRDVPSQRDSCTLIRRTLESTCPVLQVVHHGILSFFVQSCGMKFRLHSSLPVLVQKTALFMELEDTESPYLLVGRTYTDTQRIVPSSQWFMYQSSEKVLYHDVIPDGDKLRVFCNMHALGVQVRQWRHTYPYIHFVPMISKAL